MKSADTKSPLPSVISTDDLRMLLGDITVTYLNDLAREGVVERNARGEYLLSSVPRYIKTMRKRGAGPAGWHAARTKLTEEKARMATLERKQREGELVETKAAKADNVEVMLNTRNRLLVVPRKCAVMVAAERQPQACERIIYEEICSALEELVRLADLPRGVHFEAPKGNESG
jgi:phage terminase Nu1 subunit (DNA packaging protein)